MSVTYTPLRYPGGKAKLGPYLASLLRRNRLVDAEYAEPYAGGAGAGLYLLFRGFITRARLNDIDRGVISFWRAVLNQTEQFARQIERINLTVKEWDRQKDVLRTGSCGFDLGFAFFYLNRTNRSGILNGGIIGGRAQNGPWRIEARFNRTDLAHRIRAIGSLRRLISVTRCDALEFLSDISNATQTRKTLTYLDPPYYDKGRELYPNYYSPADHHGITRFMNSFRQPWVMTYDDCPEVRSLYEHYTTLTSELSYSARKVRRGREVVIFGGGLRPPPPIRQSTRHRAGFMILDMPKPMSRKLTRMSH
jgi:DNA adenine methylase